MSGGWLLGGCEDDLATIGGVGSIYNTTTGGGGGSRGSPDDSPDDYIDKDVKSDGYLKVVFVYRPWLAISLLLHSYSSLYVLHCLTCSCMIRELLQQ